MADGGAISVPAMMAIGGAVAGGAMDEENPLRGAALGAFGGYTGGAALGAMGGAAGGAAGMGGAAGSGISGGLAGSAAGAGAAGAAGAGSGMAALGGIGSGITGSTVAGGAASMGGYGGMAALGAEGSGLLGGSIAPQLASAGAGIGAAGAGGGLMGNPMAQKAVSMGGQMLMNQERQKQGAPVVQTAPPMMRPQFQPAPFMASAPSFRGVTGMPVGRFPMMNRRG